MEKVKRGRKKALRLSNNTEDQIKMRSKISPLGLTITRVAITTARGSSSVKLKKLRDPRGPFLNRGNQPPQQRSVS